jgi:VCBS repeat-containing protein
MVVGSHAETGDERKAAAAPLADTIGNNQTAAASAPRRASSTATPVLAGDPRSRRHGGEAGLLSWLTALTFSLMKEARAADPNVTFLDDGNITYKDLEHGAFELVTKEAVPRHFLVEDPGQTIVLRPQGSSVSVNQVTNSLARMAELQEAQQEVLATATKGVGSTGSSTPPSDDSLSVQPINFIQNDSLQPAQNGLAPLPASFVTVPETIIGRVPPPAPTPPTFNALTGPVETDTVAFDLFTATTGTFVASAPNGGTLTFGISGGTAGSTVLNGVTYDVSQVGPFGTLFVNSATGAYTFVPDNDAINALTAPAAANFTVTVSDGTLSAHQTFTIAINGTNDAAVISGDITGSAIEAGSVANALSDPLIATGKLTNTDVDNPPNTFTAVDSPTPSNAGYGTFTMTVAGVWIYTLDNTNHAVQALNVGKTLTDTFTVTTADGTRQLVTVTINGSNDAAIISGDTTGSVSETDAKCDAPTATGTLTAADVDNPSNTFRAVDSPTTSEGGHGTFTMTTDGVWIYTLNDDDHAVQALNVGKTLTDTFTVTSVDGTEQVVTVTINGSNDAAVIYGTKTGCVTEAGGVANAKYGKPTATGTLTDTDIDNTPNTFTAVSSPKPSTGGYGTFTMTAAGVWVYTLDDTNSAVQALNVCDTLTDTFTVTTIDGTPQVVRITIDGTNDAAVISGTKTGAVIEDGGGTYGTPTATGTLTDTDVDNPSNSFIAVNWPRESDACYGTFKMTADGVWTYKLDDKNYAVQALNDGDKLTDTFTVRTVDGTPVVVTITIHGSNDADPNDFDHLATGKKVTSDGHSFIYGTPGGDSIAGGGYHGQIIFTGAGNDTINGTGKGDLVYAGSGNDTVKGNDWDDTIYGGSGSDTINGNNGCDTIIGGYGADKLTGSNGDDRFVYLSASDSNATRFDVVSDFRSGSDRIDLTALGTLSFLDLTSTNTFVPPHTVAWLYDSATNETIVYVNSTGHTLDIGDPALVEIHLQGIAGIEPSDIVPAPTTAHIMVAGESLELAAPAESDATIVLMTAADASFDSTGGDGAPLADATRTARTSDGADSFDEARTHLSGHTHDDAAIAIASGEPTEPQHVQVAAVTESHFVFNQAPVFSHGPGIAGLNDDRTAPRLIEHGRTSDGDVQTALSRTTSESDSETGSNARSNHEDHGKWNGRHDDSGNVSDARDHGGGGRDSNSDDSNKHDSWHKQGGGEPSSIAHEVFGAGATGRFGLADSFQFKGKVPGPEASDGLNLVDMDPAPASISHHGSGKGTSGPQAIFEEAIDLSSSNHHWPDHHGNTPDHERHGVSHVQHDLIV